MNFFKNALPRRAWLFSVLITLLASSPAISQNKSVIVFSAGSTTNAVTDIAALFSQTKGIKAVTSFASSSTLARQIDKGAPAQVYISANKKWMDYLEKQALIEPGTRFNLLSNRLVLIAPHDSTLSDVTIEKGFPLATLIGSGHMAMGDPDHVPSGIYGKKAMENLKVWESVKNKIVRSKDVRAALALVARGEVPVGQVYATDAAISAKVKTIADFPVDSHPAIVYPAAIIAGQKTPEARAFLLFLSSPEAGNIFKKYGFSVK
ncbi:molybdate transport system substrate-binding protein [Desulfocicer vacuolatum DSM 3385]|uniref:Molybdate transport system substrate-binding protein n=1 Tax=Desulfocicer vacuolatum DSM 3385 TaxID=1121400 RepID=A0A1W2DK45_9BACT|nr:molybdate ABC transporter substrate-binding protein [Desulfocicer vacuolatum]SMC97452.1 molybdate transport system substrate-binding protein [Desulfocicer vacuolatum DSM 3385]